MEEIWKAVVGFEERYQVSNLGRIRLIKYHGLPKIKVLKTTNNVICLHLEKYRKRCHLDVLVAEAFLPKASIMEVVKHIDGDFDNNRVDNLEWSQMTKQERYSEIMMQNARKSPNEWFEKDGYVYFKLTNCDEYGICDKDVWEKAKQYRWICGEKNYIMARINVRNVRFHHFVISRKEKFVVDHINRNPFDNRRSNLRFATAHANSINRKVSRNNKSGAMGVFLCKNGKYRAYITCNGKRISLGYYTSLEDAKKARLEAEEKYFKPIIEKETHI